MSLSGQDVFVKEITNHLRKSAFIPHGYFAYFCKVSGLPFGRAQELALNLPSGPALRRCPGFMFLQKIEVNP